MPTTSAVGRIAAVAALVGAVIVVLLLVLGGGSSYTVTAEFENASQLVTGNNVSVAGVPVGSVKQISLSDDGQALVKLEISDSAYAPLPDGTHATIRSQSLSGIANRYVDLALPTHPDGRDDLLRRATSPRPTPPPRSTSTSSSTPSTSPRSPTSRR